MDSIPNEIPVCVINVNQQKMLNVYVLSKPTVSTKNLFNLLLYQKIKMYSSFSKLNPWFKFLISLIDLV